MYHMARGYDESSRLVSEPTSSSAPNLTVEEPSAIDIRPSTYGSVDTTVTASASDTEPLLDSMERSNRDPKV